MKTRGGEPRVWIGGRGRIRTHDLLIRSQSLYPTELRAPVHR